MWPSIEEQLEVDHVEAGSALELLIRDNQDFHLLRPEEATDELGLPPWLRVHWRKLHPESTNYPNALSNVYSWMLLHQDLPFLPAADGESP